MGVARLSSLAAGDGTTSDGWPVSVIAPPQPRMQPRRQAGGAASVVAAGASEDAASDAPGSSVTGLPAVRRAL